MAANSPSTVSMQEEATSAGLRAALRDFQSILTKDDLGQLHKIKAIPDTDAVLVFTAELDMRNRTRKGRSISSRLYSVLQSVRDFCSVVDAFVSAHPEIAGLVWGSVKLTMLIATAYTSSFETLSEIFFKVGRLCPIFREYETIYQSSKRLQKSLCDYNAAVVRCCTHAIKILRRPWHVQLLSSFTDEFKSDADSITQHSRFVRCELELAKAQATYQDQELQAAERKEAAKSRRMLVPMLSRAGRDLERLSSWQLERDKRYAHERRQKLLDTISTHDYLTPFKQSRRERHFNTAQWIFDTPEYGRWVNGTSALLWCSGKIGSGKTILASSIIDNLLTEKRSSKSLISFFFIRFDDRQSLVANHVFRSLLRQRLNTYFPSELENRLMQLVSWTDTDEIVDIMCTPFPNTQYIVIDGLDECETAARRDLLHGLSVLVSSNPAVKILISGRESISSELDKILKVHEYVSMHREAADCDIQTYIQNTIDEKIANQDLIIMQDGLVDEIKLALTKGAKGMFLWVVFQIQDLCSQHCDEDIRDALEHLPGDITETFNRAIRRIVAHGQGKHAQQVFRWVAGAKRPLTVEELREALAMEIGQENFKSEHLYNDLHRVASWCQNLVRLDEEIHLVQFAHHAVLQFLLDQSAHLDFRLASDEVDHYIGEICITYLNLSDFKKTVSRRPKPLDPVNPMNLAQMAVTHGSTGSTLGRVLRVVGRHSVSHSVPDAISADISKLAYRKTDKILFESRHPFLQYASIYWIHHTRAFEPDKSMTFNSWLRMIREGHDLAKTPWDRTCFEAADSEALDWICGYSHLPLIFYSLLSLLNSPMQMWDLVDKCKLEALRGLPDMSGTLDCALCDGFEAAIRSGDTERVKAIFKRVDDNLSPLEDRRTLILAKAASDGHLRIIDLLLKYGMNGGATDNTGQTALHKAAINGHQDVAMALLRSGANANAADNEGQTALHLTACYGHQEVAIALLRSEANANVNAADNRGQTALHLAARYGYYGVAIALLRSGANANAADNKGQTALHLTAYYEHQEVAIALLQSEANANVNAANNRGQTALHLAVCYGYYGVAIALLRFGANINAADNEGWTALHLTARYGHQDVAMALLRSGANANAANNEGQTALHLTARYGHQEVAIALLRSEANANANVNAADNEGWTALHLTARYGYQDIAIALLQSKANINAADNKGQTALHLTACYGHQEVAIALLQSGANANAADNRGQTALHLTARYGHQEVALALLRFGANINAADNEGQTALHLTARYGHQEVVIALLRSRANANAADNEGQTALHLTACYGHQKIAIALLRSGANANAADNEGQTALHLAARYGYYGVATSLLKSWADVRIADCNNRTALSYVLNEMPENGDRSRIIDLLQEAELGS